MESKPQVILVLGRPGSGKGTLCQSLVNKLSGFVHLSTGDLLRAEAKLPTKEGCMIADYIKQIKVISGKLVCTIIKKAMITYGWSKCKFLIDGCPKDDDNYTAWNEIIGCCVELKQVLYLDCPTNICEERMLKRSKIEGRVEDNKDAIAKRFSNFDKLEWPIIQTFMSKGLVRIIDSSSTVEHSLKQAIECF